MQEIRKVKNEQGEIIDLDTPIKFLRYKGLEMYLKLYFTYKVMKKRFPDNILCYTYETLTKNPENTFRSVLPFFGHDANQEQHNRMFQDALKYTSKESMMNLENRLGRSLGNDQLYANERHIRDGAIGKWKQYFSDEDLAWVESRCEPLGIRLDEFDLE